MKTSTKNVIITGCFSILGIIVGAIIAIKYQTNKSDSIIVTIKTEKDELLSENTDLQKMYNTLSNEYSELEELNISLVDENNSLKQKIEVLNNQLSHQNDELEQLKNSSTISPENTSEISSINNDVKKTVSIFNLDTFRGEGRWEPCNSESFYTDTYGNEYISAHYAHHFSVEKDNLSFVPTYLLDNKYSICEGQIAWSKFDKNLSGSIWIDFYSGDSLVYSTEPITATDKSITFSFSVEGLETLTIVRNSTRSSSQDYACIIYPYLNLVEK